MVLRLPTPGYKWKIQVWKRATTSYNREDEEIQDIVAVWDIMNE